MGSRKGILFDSQSIGLAERMQAGADGKREHARAALGLRFGLTGACWCHS